MTEFDWMTSRSGVEMATFLGERLSDRKLTLLACGVARQYLAATADEAGGRVIEVVERNAARSWTRGDAERCAGELDGLFRSEPEEGAWLPFRPFPPQLLAEVLSRPREHLGHLPVPDEQDRAAARLLREQVGNPFRPYPLEPAWRTETVLALAAGIEVDRAFDRMPILADALEDAGCDDRPTLDHLRGPGPHAVGCWVLDLILDREPELFALPPVVPTPRRMRLGPYTPPPETMA